MIVYSSTKDGFNQHILDGGIEERIHQFVQCRLGHRVGESELRSWQQSLQFMNTVLSDPSIPSDSGVFIESQLPQSSKRIDFIITGHDAKNRESVIIIELKQWSESEKTMKDAVVKVRFQHGIKETSHPSYQAWSYAAYLKDFNEQVYSSDMDIWPCAFLHNYPNDGVINDPFYQEHIDRAPLFLKNDIRKLQQFISRYVVKGDKGESMFRIESGKIRPSKSLSDALVKMLSGKQEFIMLDEQKIVFETVLSNSGHNDGKKRVIIVEGGPGTGKSVVAINLLVEILKRRMLALYVTKNAAPRDVYKSILTGQMTQTRFNSLFKGSGAFVDSKKDEFDVLLVDEAHRLNEKSGLYGNLGENQVGELINTAQTTVFFLDENQAVHIKDIGSKNEIKKWAYRYGAEVELLDLPSQFRCNGSDGYIAWLDHILDIRETANVSLTDIDYDFKVFDDPHEMDLAIREKNQHRNRSRIVAGYCWDWKSKNDDLVTDIDMPKYGYNRKWNLSEDGGLYLLKETSINEIGCIHTCQGLEMDYVGVIIGRDLLVRNGQVETHPENRSKNDHSIRGWKKKLKEEPEETLEQLDSIIKNTYRTLMTRGMKGCYVFSEDRETMEYFKEVL